MSSLPVFLDLPAKQPLIVLLKLHSCPQMNFHIIRTVTPPVPQAKNVATTAEPITVPSPDSLTDA